jgi:membrane protease YdiL (CAAX protease family)
MFSKIWSSRAFVAAELLILSILIPSVIFFFKLAPYILFILWAILVYTILVYRYVGSRQEIVVKFDLRTVVVVVCRWVVATIILLILVYEVFPDKLFIIQENNPGLIWKILIFYPVFSALPQEFIFCKFFFHRYRCFFGDGVLMVAMSAFAFCVAHILFLNWVAPILGLMAGILFANTYMKTRSLAMVALEHSLYGNALFALGLGWYFWGGSVA